MLERTRDVLRALLGLDSDPPELAVIDGWRVENHSRESSGRLLSPQDLASTMIGERLPQGDGKSAGSVTFEVDLVAGKDRAYVMVIDFAGVQGMEPRIEAVVSPTRTCVGVALATSRRDASSSCDSSRALTAGRRTGRPAKPEAEMPDTGHRSVDPPPLPGLDGSGQSLPDPRPVSSGPNWLLPYQCSTD